MRLGWVDYRVSRAARSRGYATMAEALRSELARLPGVDLVDLVPGDRLGPRRQVHVCGPHRFVATPGIRNVLWSMWEAPELPDAIAARLRMASAWVVPSTYCAEIWARAGMSAAVVPLGVGAEVCSVDPSRRRRGPVRFLCVGSNEQRKGFELVPLAFARAFGADPRVSLTLKTLGDADVMRSRLRAMGWQADGAGEVFRAGQGVADLRDLSRSELAQVYASHDVLICSSWSEGFGLPVLEAMAAGCLVVAAPVTGLADFVSARTAVTIKGSASGGVAYGGRTFEDVPLHDAEDLAVALRRAYAGWGGRKLEGRRWAGVALAREMTWARAASRLVAVVRQLDEGAAVAA